MVTIVFAHTDVEAWERVRDSGLTTQSFANPDELEKLVERSLRELVP